MELSWFLRSALRLAVGFLGLNKGLATIPPKASLFAEDLKGTF